METHFLPDLLADPDNAESERILRKCVHCGFCTATCPTFLLLGDELDSPRGRIYLIKDILEQDRPADARTVRHLDRCLSCLSCMTTCPSSVHYMHLVDHARAHVEETYARPWAERLLRSMLAFVMPRRALFRLALAGARLARPFASLAPKRLRPLLALAPRRVAPPSPTDGPQTVPAQGARRKRVALLTGCVQPVIDPTINEATIRLLTRLGVEVVVPEGAACCGALTHHMGKSAAAHASAARTIDAFWAAHQNAPLDAVIINTSGCGTTVKDYGFMFRDDPAYAEKARIVAELARDVTEFVAEIGLGARVPVPRLRLAYHSACSLQHGQRVTEAPPALLAEAGFEVVAVPEGHICCGSAGTYNLLQPELAGQLRARKAANIAAVAPDAIAAGNIGCMVQIGAGLDLPITHTVEYLDWATGGPVPEALRDRPFSAA